MSPSPHPGTATYTNRSPVSIPGRPVVSTLSNQHKGIPPIPFDVFGPFNFYPSRLFWYAVLECAGIVGMAV